MRSTRNYTLELWFIGGENKGSREKGGGPVFGRCCPAKGKARRGISGEFAIKERNMALPRISDGKGEVQDSLKGAGTENVR